MYGPLARLGMRLPEVIGTAGNDIFEMRSGYGHYGLKGDDVFLAAPWQYDMVALGGPGNDTYVAADNSVMRIIETGGFDTLIATGIGLFRESSFATTINNGQDFIGWDVFTGQVIILDNWREPQAAIEVIQLADATISSQWLIENVMGLEGFIPEVRGQFNAAFGTFFWNTITPAVLDPDPLASEPWIQRQNELLGVPQVEAAPADAVFRFYNPNTGVHFYTGNADEARSVAAENPVFAFENVSFQAASRSDPASIEIFRFFNTATGTHFYTASVAERDLVISSMPGFSYEGIVFNAFDASGAGRVGVHRFLNEATGAHFYTPSSDEAEIVNANLPTFTYEGIGFFAYDL